MFADKLHKLYDPQAINKGVLLDIDVVKAVDHIPFSKNKLLQIAGNLLSNAIKFTPRNGRIHIVLNIIVQAHQNVLAITVSDSGTGMSQELIDQILNGTAESSNGTSGEVGYGFGLSLVRHLVEGLKGSMQITSGPGQGAIFNILIPQN